MTIQQLIAELQKIENKEQDIFICSKGGYRLISDISMNGDENIIVLHYCT